MNKLTLKEQLTEKAKAMRGTYPSFVNKAMERGITRVRDRNVSLALGVGQRMPSFELKNALGEIVNSDSLLSESKIVITWYRGGWCPYCNLALRSLTQENEKIESLGAKIIAISPERPDASLEFSEKKDLPFTVLSDWDNRVAERFGLVFHLGKYLKFLYLLGGVNLSKLNKNRNDLLPLSATYIVNQEGVIEFAFVEADYKKRVEPATIIEHLST